MDPRPTLPPEPTADDFADVKAKLKAKFPRWSIIHTDKGRWWATRGPLTKEDLSRVSDVNADSPAELYVLLEAAEK